MIRVLVPTADGSNAKDAQFAAKGGIHSDVDENLPERVANAQPEDCELQERNIQPMLGHELVERERNVGQPRQPEGHDQNEGHEVGRIGQVLAQGSGVLLVLLDERGAHLAHRVENVAVNVHDGGQRGA